MSAQRDNNIKRCHRPTCSRATFVETEEGLSVDFRHGGDTHREVFTVEEMIIYLAARGFVVVEAAKVLKVA